MNHQQKDALTDVAGSLPAASAGGNAPVAAAPGTVTDASGQPVTLGINLGRGDTGGNAGQAADRAAPAPRSAAPSSTRGGMNFLSGLGKK